ncbi:MAG: hypothetical protein R3F65_25110 [bacterium]
MRWWCRRGRWWGWIDVGTPDLFPPLCALAAVSRGRTVLFGAPGFRDKECDRIAAMGAGCRALGVCAERGWDRDRGGMCRGRVHAFDDHRVHMAFSVLGVADVVEDGRGCEGVSYPGFHGDLARVRAG